MEMLEVKERLDKQTSPLICPEEEDIAILQMEQLRLRDIVTCARSHRQEFPPSVPETRVWAMFSEHNPTLQELLVCILFLRPHPPSGTKTSLGVNARPPIPYLLMVHPGDPLDSLFMWVLRSRK